ncbi:hypothetical protein [Tautonia sociabilis]|uniref:PEP-CTERM sorting domain-containing protein n=1 Tax=Tautonia sociabilis TaxID=2080755 RepID=A0A432MC96_9BACT|nr:hypothetical protein [Tautonia sociabilis]RUL81583.1 hypothetical protein TsocGM_24950 [Tautonia sociabilis]
MTTPTPTSPSSAGKLVRRARLGLALIAALLAISASRPAQADPFRFAQFDPVAGTDSNGLPIYNTWFSGTGTANKQLITTTSTGTTKVVVPITFQFTAFSGLLPAALLGPQAATLEIDLMVLNGVSTSGSRLTQTLGAGSITIRRSSTFMGQDLLLRADLVGGELSGRQGSTVGNSDVSVTAGDSITFSSSFLNFSQATTEGVTLDLNPLFPTIQRDNRGTPTTADDALRNFRALVSGQFSVDGRITVQAIPEPGSLTLLALAGFVAGPVAVARLRRRRAG